ncbi:hypothetical protein [Pedobacter chitinilyticus]|uniref:Lipoprotein n=1 Tax=Pedobacter chitinilyticus TaxID=2233776 RepID=A0A443YUD2_9SPHI|nr:hypothetical protein [Pedobacter chitinilyticus]RWU07377.1 hypothetical protein DPV69_10305 [Pedobacter chitinilyticus]
MKKNLFKDVNSVAESSRKVLLGKVDHLKEESKQAFNSLITKLYTMKKVQLMAFSMLIAFSLSCKETNDEVTYKGVVKRKTVDCTSSLGFPVVIKVYNSLEYDSIYTATLPENYQAVGSELEFKMRPLKTEDEFTLCNTTIMNPKLMVVYDVEGKEIIKK